MRNEKVRINLIYHNSILFLIRLLIVNLLLLLSIFDFYTGKFPQISLILISIFVMVEVFVKFELGHIVPRSKVSENPQDVYDSFTKQALESILFKRNTSAVIKYMNKFPQYKLFLQKIDVNPKDIKVVNLNESDLAKKAFEVSKKIKGNYVATTDILAAYFILSEPQTKLLFDHHLNEEDMINIASWLRVTVDEEFVKDNKPRFVGIGFGETLVWGWTPETKKYTNDLTFSSLKRKMIEGRESEFNTMVSALQKSQDNNVLLVGEIGTGKDNLFENLIFESYEAVLPKGLNHRRFLEIMVGPLVAGATNRADLETRLQLIIQEVKHSGNAILYIPEFQNLLGSTSYDIDLSGAILPYLKDGKMPIVATMTKGEYKKYFETNALKEVFQVINLEEPSPEISLKMLFQKTTDIERQNKVHLSYRAVLAASIYANKYDAGGALPGSAINLLNDTSNFVASQSRWPIVSEEDVLARVEGKSHIPVGEPKQEEKNLLLNLEGEMHKSIIGQDEAVKSISEALRRIRAGITRQKPISFLFLGPTGVGKTQTAKTLANIYFKGEAHIIRLDMSEYATEESMSRLIQSGSNSFMDQVFNNPFSLILLDEFEKANPKILNLFLQVFDDGRLTDQSGKTISFDNTIIIATSNAGSEFIRENLNNNANMDSKTLLDYLQKQAIFAPELLNRFDEIVTFKPLSKEQIGEITKLMLASFAKDLLSMDLTLTYDQNALNKISEGGFSEEFGARPLKRYIQDNLEDVVAKKLLTGEFKRGDRIFVDVDQDSNLTFFKAA